MTTGPLRVVVVGARRRRYGLGPHVARYLHAEGAQVVGIVGTTEDTVAAARLALRSDGIDAAGYLSLDAALEQEMPDAVALCSPYLFHREHLRAVAVAKCHCLCEKPLWWGDTEDRYAETQALLDAFLDAGCYLTLATQWPRTLAAFFRLYPELQAKPVEQFSMGLSPGLSGIEMVLDVGPHAVSMLQALAGPGVVFAATASAVGHGDLDVRFRYEHERGVTLASLQLTHCETEPRPAWYEINGCRVDRRITAPRYEIFFDMPGGAEMPVPDPVRETVRSFLSDAAASRRTERELLLGSVLTLEALYGAASTTTG